MAPPAPISSLVRSFRGPIVRALTIESDYPCRLEEGISRCAQLRTRVEVYSFVIGKGGQRFTFKENVEQQSSGTTGDFLAPVANEIEVRGIAVLTTH